MKTRPGQSKLPPPAALVPAVLAFVLIAGGVFGLLFVWHRSRLGRAADAELVPARQETKPREKETETETKTEQGAFVYDVDLLLEPGYTYSSRQVLRALIADEPTSATAEQLAELWADDARALTVVERGPFEVLERARSPVDDAIWYRVRIPEDCLTRRRDFTSVDAWIEGVQMTGARFELRMPRR